MYIINILLNMELFPLFSLKKHQFLDELEIGNFLAWTFSLKTITIIYVAKKES